MALMLALAALPLVFGEANVMADGNRLTPTNLRTYLSAPALRTADGRGSRKLRVRATADTYSLPVRDQRRLQRHPDGAFPSDPRLRP